MIYGYARVSSKGQLEGNSLEQQERALIDAGADKIIKEQFTGTTTKRPLFNNLIKDLNQGDTLVVTKLDRFARTTFEGLSTIDELLKKGVKVNILNMGMMDNTSTGVLIRTIFLAFAQFERDMIIERTQEGKAMAKSKPGFKEGRPKKYTPKQIDYALSMLTKYSYNEVAEITGISKSTLVRAARKKRAS